MSDPERMQLIANMGLNIANMDSMIKQRDGAAASAAYVQFMGAAGMLAQEIDELNRSNGN